MTPRELDPDVVQRRLRLMSDLLDDLDAVGDVAGTSLAEDRMLRHAIERILSQLVELSVSVNGHLAATVAGQAPKDYRSSFDLAAATGLISGELAARLQPSVGLRNVLAHEYVEVDLDQVAAGARAARDDYRDYVASAARWLSDLG